MLQRPLLPGFALASLLLAAPALARNPQTGPESSNDIIVTGRGLDPAAGEAVYDQLSIGRDRLTGSASNRLEDILRDVPGFQNFRRSDSRSANPTSQGATLRALGGKASSRALLILDGVPQTDPFGGWIYWPAYDPRRLGSVRVVRGGGSGAYGPGALAGTIELTSAGLADIAGLSGGLAYGSRDSVDANLLAAARLGQGHALLSAGFARGDGFVPVVAGQRGPVDRASPYRQANLALRAVAPLTDGIELQAGGLWFSDERERGTAFSDIFVTGADASLRLVARGRWRWSALVYAQLRDYSNAFASVNAARTIVTQASDQYSVPSTGLGARFELRPPLPAGIELRLGADWRRNAGETRERFNFVAGIGTRGRIAGGETDNFGGFAEAAWTSGAWTLTAGGRIDRWSINDGFLDENILATSAVLNALDYPDRSGWEPTGRAGIAWQPVDSVTLHSAAYLGWRLPTLNELYRPFRVGADVTAANPALDPERLKGVEAGVLFTPYANAHLGITLFANRLEHAIGNVTLFNGPGTFPDVGFVPAGGTGSQRRNLDAVEAHGVELDGRLTLARWTLSAGYAHIAAKVRARGAALLLDGRRPAQTPRDTGSATLAWLGAADARASLTVRYVGAQYEDDLGSKTLPAAFTIDAAASLPVAKRLSLEARGENITDKRVVAGISGAGIVERATPRTLWIGLSLRP
ncbi:MAG: TonB-dependent receptor [Alphaproteobacteria bacterium]|nr:TonB-dependent receptor [Alphaproteobacteria bacterium]